MDLVAFERHERSLFMVVRALEKVRRQLDHADLLRLQIEWTIETLRHLMLEAGCYDPTLHLSATVGSAGSAPASTAQIERRSPTTT
jgi:hypothetical protein